MLAKRKEIIAIFCDRYKATMQDQEQSLLIKSQEFFEENFKKSI